jgi:membrane-associated phospholipid phosphatase
METRKLIRQAGEAALDVDDRTRRLFKPYAESSAVAALHPLSKLGDQPALRRISVGLIVAGVVLRSHRMANAGARMIIAHEAATFAKDVIKTDVDRTRPRSAAKRKEKKPTKGNHTSKEMTSFPSGHSAGAVAAARAFAREYPEHGLAAVGAAGFLALLQIVRSAHYPTDVAAGIGVGLLAEKATDLAWSAAGIG